MTTSTTASEEVSHDALPTANFQRSEYAARGGHSHLVYKSLGVRAAIGDVPQPLSEMPKHDPRRICHSVTPASTTMRLGPSEADPAVHPLLAHCGMHHCRTRARPPLDGKCARTMRAPARARCSAARAPSPGLRLFSAQTPMYSSWQLA